MYWNIIDEERYKLLKKICENVTLDDYYMVGGTALSIQLGLRESFDFDFCVRSKFNNDLLVEELNKIGKVEVKQNQIGTVDVLLNNVQVSFFYYPNNVLKEFIKTDEIENLKMASIIDIAAMKVAAIGGRGAKKDFFDLYNIMNKENISVKEIAEAVVEKFGMNVNYVNMIMGLSYFDDAEDEILLETFVKYDWNEIKKYFINIQSQFKDEIEKIIL